MKVIETENELVLQDKSGYLLFLVILLVSVSTVVLPAVFGGTGDYTVLPKYVIYFAVFAIAIVVGVGIWQLFATPLSQIVIDSQTKTVASKQRGFLKKSVKIYARDEIEEFSVKRDKDDEGVAIWQVELFLTNGETIKITNVWHLNEQEVRRAAAAANRFLRK